MDTGEGFLYQHMEAAYPIALSCAERMHTYLLNNNKRITDEEVAYLAVHIAKLTNQKD